MSKQALLKLMKDRALTTGVDIVLRSGARSGYYMDCRAVSMTCDGRRLIKEVGEEMLWNVSHDVLLDGIGGVAVGGIPVAMSFADGEDVFIIRPAKSHGLQKELEGADHLVEKNVVVVEDTVTTGGSLEMALQAVVRGGLKPIGAFSLVDRRADIPTHIPLKTNGDEWLHIPYHPVFVLRDPGILSIM